MSGHSRKEADGMELVVCGLISIAVGLALASGPIVIVVMNTKLFTVIRLLLNTMQIFIPVQEVALQAVLLLITVPACFLGASYVTVAETIMLIYLGAQCQWIILLKQSW